MYINTHTHTDSQVNDLGATIFLMSPKSHLQEWTNRLWPCWFVPLRTLIGPMWLKYGKMDVAVSSQESSCLECSDTYIFSILKVSMGGSLKVTCTEESFWQICQMMKMVSPSSWLLRWIWHSSISPIFMTLFAAQTAIIFLVISSYKSG